MDKAQLKLTVPISVGIEPCLHFLVTHDPEATESLIRERDDARQKFAHTLTELAGCQAGASTMSGWLEDLCSIFPEPTEAEELGARVRGLFSRVKVLEEGAAKDHQCIIALIDQRAEGKAEVERLKEDLRQSEEHRTAMVRHLDAIEAAVAQEKPKPKWSDYPGPQGYMEALEAHDLHCMTSAAALRVAAEKARVLADDRLSEIIALKVERGISAKEAEDRCAKAALNYFNGVYPFTFPEQEFWKAVARATSAPQANPEEILP